MTNYNGMRRISIYHASPLLEHSRLHNMPPHITILSSLSYWEKADVQWLQVWFNSLPPHSPWSSRWVTPVLWRPIHIWT